MSSSIDPHPLSLLGIAEAPFAAQMATSLRTQAMRFGAGPLSVLSTSSARRLSFVCNGFAALIEAAEATGLHMRSRASFLVSALASLGGAEARALLTEVEEVWMVAEVEHEFGEAIALFEARTGQPHTPAPPRPVLRPWGSA